MAEEDKIRKVQEAEETAKLMLDNAAKKKVQRIADAKAKAAKLVQDAEMSTKGVREKAVSEATEQIEKEKKERIEAAREEAKKMSKVTIKKGSVKKIAERAVRRIVG